MITPEEVSKAITLALGFYAALPNYHNEMNWSYDTAIMYDKGHKARAAIELMAKYMRQHDH